MEAGEKEIRKAFESNTTRNVLASINYSNETRKIIRDLQDKIILLENKVLQFNDKFETVQKQIVQLQMKSYDPNTIGSIV